jgi:hypothetical protein
MDLEPVGTVWENARIRDIPYKVHTAEKAMKSNMVIIFLFTFFQFEVL